MRTGETAFLRVREAAAVLGISNSAAYELANAWLATDGRTGLPAVRMGRRILIPERRSTDWPLSAATMATSSTSSAEPCARLLWLYPTASTDRG